MKTVPGFKSFCGAAVSGHSYTDLAHEVGRLKADNAALLQMLHGACGLCGGRGTPCSGVIHSRASRADHPGSALLDELENLRKQVSSLRTDVDEAHASSKYQATRADSEMLGRMELEKQVETLKHGQRSASEARQRAFLELAEDLAAMTPEKRDSAIKRIIGNAGENRP